MGLLRGLSEGYGFASDAGQVWWPRAMVTRISIHHPAACWRAHWDRQRV